MNADPLQMIITGIAGSGKSYLINCIKKLLGKKCLLTSYFGIAAFNINGRTLHSTLKLPIRSKLKHELKGKSLDNLQTDLKDIEYIIIDEFSVVGQRLLGWIDSRCRQATGKLETLFGGISIILVGDVAQLPPVMDDVLYHSFPKNEIAVAGYLAYCCFRTVVKLKANMRSAGEDESQKKFRKALRNLRNGKSTLEDWNFFLTRQPEKNLVDYNKCIRLSFANEIVREHNGKMLDSLQSPIAVIKAKNTPPSASKASSEEFGLVNEVFLAKGAKVMLTRNLWSDVGLCNGSLGIVKDIIFQRNHLPPALPITIIVKFDKYTGPSFFDDEDNCVPIVPIVETSSEDNIQKERMQIPLKLAWSITIHKSQGLTLDKVVVDLGKKESMDGLTYVALSRVKKLSDMVIESFPFERINKLSEGKRFKFRVREESRLEELAARKKP
ncbi:ATP-dependent DNA helicase PIF1-like [Clytia hemisphaerica]|uniref:ATP-dependent DNA helicase PIF1-like n=1 Tax=Clytia hemisphaerica TaxID=252671 RepID=UPI0034D61A65